MKTTAHIKSAKALLFGHQYLISVDFEYFADNQEANAKLVIKDNTIEVILPKPQGGMKGRVGSLTIVQPVGIIETYQFFLLLQPDGTKNKIPVIAIDVNSLIRELPNPIQGGPYIGLDQILNNVSINEDVPWCGNDPYYGGLKKFDTLKNNSIEVDCNLYDGCEDETPRCPLGAIDCWEPQLDENKFKTNLINKINSTSFSTKGMAEGVGEVVDSVTDFIREHNVGGATGRELADDIDRATDREERESRETEDN